MSSNNNLEIERKFLVAKIPENLEKYQFHKIKQAYISTLPTLRIRQSDNDYIFTFKGRGDVKRVEFEYNLSKEEFDNLWKKTETKKIDKTRYLIPLENDLIAELDIYEGELKGFMNVEVEFKNLEDAEKFKAPDWFGKDISYDKEYSNSWIAANGIPQSYKNYQN